ncbi:MAG: ribonuclease HII [Actinomycetota bacterium]
MRPDGAIERELHDQGFALVAGVDEVGRGALAGPLVAGAVILPDDFDLPGLNDSKLLTPKQRDVLAVKIRAQAVALTLVRVTPAIIDRRGLHKSNIRALRAAIARLEPRPNYALSDGFSVPRMPVPTLSIRKGDRVAASVAAASIVAKVVRDRTMRRLHRRFPEFGFASNKGYGTREHWTALRAHGPTPVHRMSFKGVGAGGTIEAELLEAELDELTALGQELVPSGSP